MEEKNEPLPVLDPEDASWLLAQIAERHIRIPAPVHEGPAFGRRAVQDFNQERVLDRLLMYERRIEHSLYRTMAELQKQRLLREQNSLKAGATAEAGLPNESVGQAPPYNGSRLPEGVGRGRPTYEEPPCGVSTNVPEAEEQSCETNPISAGPGEEHVPCSKTAEEVGRGRPTLDQVEGRLYEEGSQTRSVAFGSPETPDGVTANGIDAQGQVCETNPISAGAKNGQVGYRPIFRRRR